MAEDVVSADDSSTRARSRSRVRGRVRRVIGALRSAVVAVLVDRRPHGYLRAAANTVLDRRKGLDTAGVVSRKALGIQEREVLHYEPSPWVSLRRILRADEIDESDVFLDIGSGKGRVLFEAAQYPFARVIGVELSEQLNEVARDNVRRNRHRLRSPVEIHTADATTFEVPKDVTVAYLYNPVVGALFKAALENLITSVDRYPRTLRLVCRSLAPEEAQVLEATGRFRLEREVLAPRPSKAWAHRAALRLYLLEPVTD